MFLYMLRKSAKRTFSNRFLRVVDPQKHVHQLISKLSISKLSVSELSAHK